MGSEIAARNRKSLATFHRTVKSQCNIALSCLRNRAISGVREGHCNRKSQKSLRFRCAKLSHDCPGLGTRLPFIMKRNYLNPPIRKNTHPNKNTICANNFGTICTNCPPFFLSNKQKQKEFAQTVCTKCFYMLALP